MRATARSTAALLGSFTLLGALAGCATSDPAAVFRGEIRTVNFQGDDAARLINRVTWGVNSTALQEVAKQGLARFLESQLHPAWEQCRCCCRHAWQPYQLIHVH